MRQVPLECDISIAVIGLFLVRNLHEEWPFMAMLISCSRGTCLILNVITFCTLPLITPCPAGISRHPRAARARRAELPERAELPDGPRAGAAQPELEHPALRGGRGAAVGRILPPLHRGQRAGTPAGPGWVQIYLSNSLHFYWVVHMPR